jgi:hypothetical protein
MSKRRLLLAISILALLTGLLFVWSRTKPTGPTTASELNRLAAELAALEAREQQIATTVWAGDGTARQFGRLFEDLWDSLNRAEDKFEVLERLTFKSIQPGQREADNTLGHGITRYLPTGTGREWTPLDWQRWLGELRETGWRLGAVEFRHNRFNPADDNGLARSLFYFSAQLTNSGSAARATAHGDLDVTWSTMAADESAVIDRLDARNLAVAVRAAAPGFEEILNETIAPPDKSFFIDPLILHDLDGDGLSEIILAASNTRFDRQTDGSYVRSSLCRHPIGLIFTAVVADFDRDGAADFLCARHDGLHLFRGSPEGTFDEPGMPVWTASLRIKYGQVLTCGDVDGDGDLDVWLGQYRSPYEKGQMPTPYHDANDGYPAWLLLNDGGRFIDATEAAGLTPKRFRRSYAGSFVELNGDGHLDLLVVSDFAGVDLYLNDGRGRFTDVTDTWIPIRHGFGMAHNFADFNRDGHLDLMITGMHCPTALRMDHLGLVRPGYEDYARLRPVMTAGNRLWLAANGSFHLAPANDSLANSGWSWACLGFDADNDSWPDLFVANGHETRQSVRDYEPEFWWHDIYVGDSNEDLVRTAYFGAKTGRTRGRGWSYGGYEMNRLYLNYKGTGFVEVGHLLGVGLQLDCRTAVQDDLDGDGRVDLVVTSFEVWPEVRQTIRIYRNQLEQTGNWIGFRFGRRHGGPDPMGVTVRVRTSQHEAVRQVVTGDSHRAQHATTVHFGLGVEQSVESVVIQWPHGKSLELADPVINRYHLIEGNP